MKLRIGTNKGLRKNKSIKMKKMGLRQMAKTLPKRRMDTMKRMTALRRVVTTRGALNIEDPSPVVESRIIAQRITRSQRYGATHTGSA